MSEPILIPASLLRIRNGLVEVQLATGDLIRLTPEQAEEFSPQPAKAEPTHKAVTMKQPASTKGKVEQKSA